VREEPFFRKGNMFGKLRSPKEYAQTLLGHSSTLSHLRNLFKGLVWSAGCLRREGKSGVAALNHLVAALADCLLGIVFMHLFLSLVTPQLLVDWTMSIIDVSGVFFIIYAYYHTYMYLGFLLIFLN